MRTLIIGGIIFILFCLFARWHYTHVIKGVSDSAESSASAPKHDFHFETGSFDPQINNFAEDEIQNLIQQLKENDQLYLVITGVYTEEEKDADSQTYENIGIARANAIRDKFVSNDIALDRISLAYELEEDPILEFIRFELTEDASSLAQYTFEDMSFSNITFGLESAVFRNPPKPFIRYADSLKTFLIENPDRRIVVTGHTDNSGEEELNYKLGIRRGNSVEYYLRTKIGIKTPIKVASEGELAPVADNDTPEGRKKNRRVQITIH